MYRALRLRIPARVEQIIPSPTYSFLLRSAISAQFYHGIATLCRKRGRILGIVVDSVRAAGAKKNSINSAATQSTIMTEGEATKWVDIRVRIYTYTRT